MVNVVLVNARVGGLGHRRSAFLRIEAREAGNASPKVRRRQGRAVLGPCASRQESPRCFDPAAPCG
jgi:hypothetical protein